MTDRLISRRRGRALGVAMLVGPTLKVRVWPMLEKRLGKVGAYLSVLNWASL